MSNKIKLEDSDQHQMQTVERQWKRKRKKGKSVLNWGGVL